VSVERRGGHECRSRPSASDQQANVSAGMAAEAEAIAALLAASDMLLHDLD